jgi:phenylacetate-CoA oxygenase PaaH subunit
MVWEVFRQEREGQAFQHAGAFEAPDRAFAEAYAREFYGRRKESVALWVVPRAEILDIEEPNVDAVFERDYRRVDGYSIKLKLREARERAGVGAGLVPPAKEGT